MRVINVDVLEVINAHLNDTLDVCCVDTTNGVLIEDVTLSAEHAWEYLTRNEVNIEDYTFEDMLSTLTMCQAILKLSNTLSCTADSSEIRRGFGYGTLASTALVSLKKCFYQLIKLRDIDIQEDFPFDKRV